MKKPDTSKNQVKTVYLAIGSNLGDRLENLNIAKFKLQSNGIDIFKCSSNYESLSWPNPKYPKFINIVIKVKTYLSEKKLLLLCNKIENELGRFRVNKNEPRTCDIDLIDFNGKILSSKNLTIPHPRAHLRNFVLFPINEISPTWIHPILNKRIDFLIKKLSFKLRNEITIIKEHVIIDE